MLPKGEKKLIDVNYKKPPADVYKDATLGIVETHHDLSILQECEFQEGLVGPTWVPNWGADTQVDMGAYLGFKTSRLAAILDASQAAERGVMRIVGPGITAIEDLRPSGIDLESADLSAKLRNLFSGIQTEGDYVAEGSFRYPESFRIKRALPPFFSGGTLREAYAAALLRGKVATATEPENYGCSSLDYVASAVQLVCSPSATKNLPLKKESLVDLRMFCARRQLLRGSNGYIGMAPPAARTGHLIYNVSGCDYSLLLWDAGERQFQVVGCCFVSGAMEFQALLGPLPARVEAVFFRANCNCLGFRNRVTRDLTD
ncbi:Uu.00g123770.m01.CDS01 [Anthostomella pinea]|uniref:Uu.00g123770.m01.CDS01 n=1 Tax=Anthostomella pinea TaxID=933095 RepID=A0AAI8VHH2_9PEZI|nr:Uu.00g123770.m01.CDS01 [Anthostomella pinea]